MYKNYVFDLYGTLADIHTDEGLPELWEGLAKKYSDESAKYSAGEIQKRYGELVEDEKNFVRKAHPGYEHIDIRIENVFRRLYNEKGAAASEKLVLDTALFFRRASREYIRLYDGIAELLGELQKYGKVYLLTNAQRSFTWDELGTLGILDKFDGIVISSDEGCCKPDKAFYQTIIDRYGLDPSETIMTGNDPDADIRGGKAAGFDTLYIHSNISPEIDYDTGCTYFIPDGNTLRMRDFLI